MILLKHILQNKISRLIISAKNTKRVIITPKNLLSIEGHKN